MKVEIVDGKYILNGLQEFEKANWNRGRIYKDNLFIKEMRRWVMSNRRSKIIKIYKKREN